MADIYILPNGTDTESLLGFFKYTNTVSDGLFFPVILLVVWFISFISMLFTGDIYRQSAPRAFTFASFFTAILSVPLALLDMLNINYMYLLFALVGAGAMWLVLTNARE